MQLRTADRLSLVATRLLNSSPLPPTVRQQIVRRVAAGRVDDRAALHDFWRQPAPDGNVPQDYFEHPLRSQAVAALLAAVSVPKGGRILEVGCNVGRNLAHLADVGYERVEGVEISGHAVELLRRHYPQLAGAPVHVGAAEDVLPQFGDDTFAAVFTMAVLEHIHPASTEVFDQMGRITRDIVAIEPSGHSSHRQFPHDVPALFRQRGFRLVSDTPMSELVPADAGEDAIRTYRAFRLHRD